MLLVNYEIAFDEQIVAEHLGKGSRVLPSRCLPRLRSRARKRERYSRDSDESLAQRDSGRLMKLGYEREELGTKVQKPECKLRDLQRSEIPRGNAFSTAALSRNWNAIDRRKALHVAKNTRCHANTSVIRAENDDLSRKAKQKTHGVVGGSRVRSFFFSSKYSPTHSTARM